MKTRNKRFVGVAAMAVMYAFSAGTVSAQWTALTNPAIMGAATLGATVGTLAGPAALNVHGDQMAGGGNIELFRTRTGTGQNGFWRAFRGTVELGNIRTTNPGRGFHVRAVQGLGNAVTPPGILWLENHLGDGIMIRANGIQLANVNGYALRVDGFASMGVQNNGTEQMPSRARWHLVDVDAVGVVEPWRPYFRNGVLFTGNNDMAFIGHRYHDASNGTTAWTYTLDQSDLIINAGENSLSETTRQRTRFTYTTTPTGATTGAASYNGLEFMQCWPENANQGYVGIGDFYAATVANGGVQVNPAARLDVLNGDVRIRDLPLAANDRPNFDKFVVVNGTTGELRWRNISSVPGAPDCDWNINSVNKYLTTAWDVTTPAGCPKPDWNVSVGDDGFAFPNAKFSVVENTPYSTNEDYGIRVKTEGEGGSNYGLLAECNPASTFFATKNVGLSSSARNATNTFGLETYANITATGGNSVQGIYAEGGATQTVVGVYGVSALARSSATSNADVCGMQAVGQADGGTITNCYGVRGVSRVQTGAITTGYGVYGFSSGATTNWAGYFDGNVNLNGDLYHMGNITSISDASLKTNIQPMQGSLGMLLALAPKTYQFDNSVRPELNLPAGPQFGFLAQEVNAVLPAIVKEVPVSAVLDSMGQELAPAIGLLGVNYEALIPLLVGAVQEQQTQISALQQQLASCCAIIDGPQMQGQGGGGSTGTQDLLRNASADQLTIAPNPFDERTTITYRSDARGRVALRVSDGRGQHIDTLRDQQQDAGTYTYEWNTQDLAPGTYTITLLLDGQVLMERAVKVAR